VSGGRLPLHLPVVDGESFRSYADRSAADLGMSLSELLVATGVVDDPRVITPPLAYGAVLPGDRLRRFSYATRLLEARIEQMLLSCYHGTVIDLSGVVPSHPSKLSRVAFRRWVYVVGSHACPDCLRELEGAWLVAWKLPWFFACVRHRRLLVDTCPRCRRRLGAGMQDGRSAPTFRSRVPVPGYCGNTLPKGLAGRGRAAASCGQPLAEISSDSVGSYPALLAAQALLNAAMDGAAMTVADAPVASLDYFADLRALCALLLFGCRGDAPPDGPPSSRAAVATYAAERDAKAEARRAVEQEGVDFRRGPRTRYFTPTPRSAALMAAIVPPAVAILAADSPADFVQRMKPYVEAAERRGRAQAMNLPAYFEFSPRLRTAFGQCLAPSMIFTHRAGLHARTVRRPRRYYAFTPAHVPQLLWSDLYASRFAGFFPGRSPDYVRRYCSMALVKLCGTYTWTEAARLLDLHGVNGARFANGMVVALTRGGQADVFAARLHEVAEWLEADLHRVDFAARRRALSDFREIPWPEWSSLCAQAGLHPGRLGGRNRYGAAWLWCHLTLGDHHFAPALHAGPRDTVREVYRRFINVEFPKFQAVLTGYGTCVLAISSPRELPGRTG
jgi:hypothetical protein